MTRKILFAAVALLLISCFTSCTNIKVNDSKVNELDERENIKWVISPQYEFEEIKPIKDYFIDGSGYNSLLIFVKNGKQGVIDYNANIIVSESENVQLCLCGIVDQRHEFYFDETGAKSETGGHGLPNISYYDPNKNKTFDIYDTKIPRYDNISISDQYNYLKEFKIKNEFVYYEDPTERLSEKINTKKLEKIDDKYILIDIIKGYALNNDVYENYKHESDGLFAVKKNGGWGYVNSATGKIEIPCAYYSASPFSDNIAAVTLNGKAGFINKQAKPCSSFVFDETTSVNSNKAWVKYKGKWGVVEVNNTPS